jgi:hypothetical protein
MSTAVLLPLERREMSSQCGAASTLHGDLLARGEPRRTLDLVTETARAVGGRRWPRP